MLPDKMGRLRYRGFHCGREDEGYFSGLLSEKPGGSEYRLAARIGPKSYAVKA
jgi:hypothetical protein